MRHFYVREKYGTGVYRVEREIASMHSGHHSNVHTWVLRRAFGGRVVGEAGHTSVSHIFIESESDRVPFRKLPIRWRRLFRRSGT